MHALPWYFIPSMPTPQCKKTSTSVPLPKICIEIRWGCDYADGERSHGYQMSDVRYAFSDPGGMEMIIMVIIQHLNNAFSVQNTGKPFCPGTWCWCLFVTTNIECVSRGYRRRRGTRRGKVMKKCTVCSSTVVNLVEALNSPSFLLAPILGFS